MPDGPVIGGVRSFSPRRPRSVGTVVTPAPNARDRRICNGIDRTQIADVTPGFGGPDPRGAGEGPDSPAATASVIVPLPRLSRVL